MSFNSFTETHSSGHVKLWTNFPVKSVRLKKVLLYNPFSTHNFTLTSFNPLYIGPPRSPVVFFFTVKR